MWDWNAHHVGWSRDGSNNLAGRILEKWRNARGARLVVGRKYTFER